MAGDFGKLGLPIAAVVAGAAGDFENFLAAATPGGIEAQEARGQAKMCGDASHLPVRMNGYHKSETWENIEKHWGIKRGPVEDKIFYSVTLPTGWKLTPTDHSMWSELVDAEGAKRAAIFFKAAFYDYNAHLSLNTRFSVQRKYNEQNQNFTAVEVRDGDKVLFSVSFPPPLANDVDQKTRLNRYREEEELVETAVAWLNEQYPDNKDPFAYWPETTCV